jgi:excisionase family DNA binding protein
MPPKIKLGAQLITAHEAAELLNVNVRTIHGWIAKGTIPYVTLPSSGTKPSYRIPLHGLLESLSGNYDLAAEVEELFGEGGAAPAEEEGRAGARGSSAQTAGRG